MAGWKLKDPAQSKINYDVCSLINTNQIFTRIYLLGRAVIPYAAFMATLAVPATATHNPNHGGGGGGGPGPITVTVNSGLDFGAVAADPVLGGTVTIDAGAGNKTVVFLTDLGGTHNRAEFKIAGDKNENITISIQDPYTLGSLSGSSLTHDCSNPCSIPGKGNFTLYVGGQVSVPANSDLPSQSGTFEITVDYVDTPGNSTIATATSSISVVQPIGISETSSLNYGTFSESGNGTIVIDTSGNRTASTKINLQGGIVNQGVFNVTGTTNEAYSVTITPGTLNCVSSCGGGNKTTMSLDSFTHDADGVISAGGESINVGATLSVNTGQVLGNYTGTYNVTVNYN